MNQALALFERLSLDELWRDPSLVDRAAVVTNGIDRYCSSAAWTLPAHAAFHPQQAPWLVRTHGGLALLCGGHAPSIGRYLSPLEAMWGLASPLLGEDTRGVVDGFYEAVVADRGSWDALWLGGLEVDGLWLDTLIRRFGPSFRLRRGPLTRRHSASLDGGFDGFLGRRKRTFRKNLRRAGRRVQEAGLSFDHAGNAEDADAIYARIQAIEARSWKGKADSGISSGGMYVFYEHAVRLLVASGSLRAVFAVLDGRDVGFLFGGVLGDTFRGLQCSFDDDYRSLQLGNVLQATMIEALCSSGEVSDYDLGSDMPYKTRWAEGGLETVTLLVAGR